MGNLARWSKACSTFSLELWKDKSTSNNLDYTILFHPNRNNFLSAKKKKKIKIKRNKEKKGSNCFLTATYCLQYYLHNTRSAEEGLHHYPLEFGHKLWHFINCESAHADAATGCSQVISPHFLLSQ